MAHLLQWEYRVETLGSFFSGAKDDQITALLNEWGEEGWEVIHLIHLPNSEKLRVVAKRPSAHPARRPRRWPDGM
jgi:hypothetical protein